MTDTSLRSYLDPESGPTWPPRFVCGLTASTRASGEHCFCLSFRQLPIPGPNLLGALSLSSPPLRSRPATVSSSQVERGSGRAPPERADISTSNDLSGSVADSSLGARLNHHVTSWKGRGPSSATLLGSHASAAPRFSTPDALVSPLISPAPKWAAWRPVWNPTPRCPSVQPQAHSTSFLPVLPV